MAQSNGDYIALFSTRKPYKPNKFERYEGHKVINFNMLQYQLHYYGMQSWKIPYPWRLIHLRKNMFQWKSFGLQVPIGKAHFKQGFPHPPSPPHINYLSGILNHMPGWVPTPSLAHCLKKITFIHNSWSKQNDIYFHFEKLVMWKVWRRNRSQSQIHPLRECTGLYKKNFW